MFLALSLSLLLFLSLSLSVPLALSFYLACISVCPYFCLISPLTLFLSLTLSLLSLSTCLCLFYQWTLARTAWLKVWKILDLNETVPIASTFEHFAPVGSTVWGGLGGSALLEEVCYWWRTLGIKSLACLQFALYFMLVLRMWALSVLSCHHVCHLLPCFPAMMALIPIEP